MSTSVQIEVLNSNGTKNAMLADSGAILTRPYASGANTWNYAAASGGIVNTTTAVTIKAAAGAGLRNCITSMTIMAEALGAATELVIRDGAAGPVLWRTKITTAGHPTVDIDFPVPIRSSVNTLLEVATLTASVTGAVYFNCAGYVSA